MVYIFNQKFQRKNADIFKEQRQLRPQGMVHDRDAGRSRI